MIERESIFVIVDLKTTLKDRPRSGKPRKLMSVGEAYLIATICSHSPSGSVGLNLKRLADKLVSLKVVDSISQSINSLSNIKKN